MIQLSNYQLGLTDQVTFGGQTTAEELDNLNKALSAGSITGRETTNLTTASGSPLKVESLEKTLKTLTFSEQDVKFWKQIPKAPAFNTVEEYNQLTSYGQDRGGFYSEGETPAFEDSTYVRRAQLVKYLGVTKSVTHPMTLVNTMIGSAIDQEARNGTMWILRKLDRALFTGNSANVPEEFNGLFTQHAQNDAFLTLNDYFNSEVVVDCRGLALTEANIEDAANGIIQNFGIGTQLYAPPKVLSDFVKNFYGNKFIQPNTAGLTAGVMGQAVKSFESQFGNIGLNHDIFMNQSPSKTNTSAATSANAPGAPTADGTTPAAAVASDASGKFDAGAFGSGNYIYAVSGVNKYGESALTVLGAVTTIVTGGAADLKFTSGGGTFPATSYTIYRSQKGAASAGAATFYPLFTISTAQVTAGYDGAAAGLVRDRNRFIGNTNQAMLIQESQEILCFKQLAPLMKMDLAITGPAFNFMVLMYGTPFLYAPKKMVRFINIAA
jgi:hypothetical protein